MLAAHCLDQMEPSLFGVDLAMAITANCVVPTLNRGGGSVLMRGRMSANGVVNFPT